MISKTKLKYIKSLEIKKFRQKERAFVAEGPKVVGDLLRHAAPTMIVATAAWLDRHADVSSLDAEVFEVTGDELRQVSFLQHPQEVLAVFPLPAADGAEVRPDAASRLLLALDGVQDPGNLGTIIRIADWFGIGDIVCSSDTADAYNPKVVQATMGSIARVRVSYTDLPAWLDRLPGEVPVYGLLLDGDNIYTQELSGGGVIIMGNEGKGLSGAVRRRVTKRLLIPNCPLDPLHPDDSAESLNVAVATAVTCAEFRRRQHTENLIV